MTSTIKIQPTQGNKLNHNEGQLLVQPTPDQGNKRTTMKVVCRPRNKFRSTTE